MILSRTQIRTRYDHMESRRRKMADSKSVAALKIVELKERMENYISLRDLRLEMKRRKERLRYLKIMANPKTRSEYRARKRAEYARKHGRV